MTVSVLTAKKGISMHLAAPPRHRAGFTLVELLVVVAIIGILIGLVLGISGYAGRKSASTKAISEIERIKTALEEYRIINGRYYPGTSVAVTNPVFIAAVMSLSYPGANNGVSLKNLAKMDGLDPWGRTYLYSNSTAYAYRLWSRGADMTNPSDDIESGIGNY